MNTNVVEPISLIPPEKILSFFKKSINNTKFVWYILVNKSKHMATFTDKKKE